MRTKLRLFTLAYTVLLLPVAHAQYHESGGGQSIIGSGHNNTTFYAPAFAYSEPGCNKPDKNGNLITGHCVLLYVQGDQSLSDTTYLDQILMFWNPNTWSGLTSPYAGPDRLLPSQDHLGNPHVKNHHYGHPSVLTYNGNYYMTAHESPDAANFKKHWWGVSPDGKSWTWYQLFQYTGSGNLDIPGVSLQPRSINGQVYFYGLMEMASNAGIGSGAIRLRVNTARARGYDRVEMYTSSGWATIADDLNPNGNFTTIPAKLIDARTNPTVLDNGEVWFSALNETRDCSNCSLFSGPQLGWGDRFAIRTLIVPSSLSSPPSFGSESFLSSSVRCIPAKYDNSRAYPMPLSGGSPRLLYSATNDQDYGSGAYCTQTGPNTFPGMYIVVTAF